MPASPAMRFSPGMEPRTDNHKRGRSLESGIVFKERDDDLALFNEVQRTERDNFLLQSNDDFEDTFVTKLRHFSDHKLEINIATRGESSNLLNAEEEKNDYEWLITPPDTPLFPSLDDETPQVIPAQRGRPRAQPISISRSSTMEKSHRSSRGSASPNRLSPSPRSREPTIQPRGRATSAPSSSPPPTRRPVTGSKRPSSPSSKPSTPPPRVSTPTSRRLSTGSTSTTRGISGNSVSPKVRAWQVNIPGFSTEAPPNLRTSLADRPSSYVRGSSPASRNGRHSKSPTASRSISSSHSHKGSIASSADDDVESLPSIAVDGSDRSNSKRVGGFWNNNTITTNYNKVPFSQKPSRTVSSSSAPKRSFDMALRQMDQRKSPQNMFRPLLSSVPSSNFYAGKSSPAWNSSVTTSSNASSDLGTSGPHDIEENELNDDEATSGIVKLPDSNVDEEVFMFEKTDSLKEDKGNETHEISPNEVGVENLVQRDFSGQDDLDDLDGQDDFPEVDSLKGMLICSRCSCEYSVITQTEDEIELCPNCQKSTSSLTNSDTVTNIVAVVNSEQESTMSDKDHKMNLVKVESLELTSKGESQSEKHEDLAKDDENSATSLSGLQLEECEPTQVNHSQPSLSYSDIGGEQIQHTVDFSKSKVDSVEGEGISIVLRRSSSIIGPVIQNGNFSASSISYDDLSYVRDSTNSMRSSVGRGSFSASSSVDFGPRFQSQPSSRKSDIENYKYDPMTVKHRRSVSSLSGHDFRPSSVGTSTLDSFDVSIVRVGTDAAESAPQENPSENDTCTENVGSGEVLLPESVNVEEDVGNDTSALMTCTIEEGTSVNPCVESADVAEVQLGAISEGEVDHTYSSSPASQSHVSQSSESSIEEFRDPHVSTAITKDMEASAMVFNTSNHSSSTIEESTVLVDCQGGIKGRSLTLEEATDTILFCSSIVHNLAYEAATIAVEKQTPPESSRNDNSWPLVPAVTKSYSGRKDLQTRKTSKRSSKSQKTKRKTVEKDTMYGLNSINTGEETDLPKTCIVYPNNKENTKPPMLESKCNCIIM